MFVHIHQFAHYYELCVLYSQEIVQLGMVFTAVLLGDDDGHACQDVPRGICAPGRGRQSLHRSGGRGCSRPGSSCINTASFVCVLTGLF